MTHGHEESAGGRSNALRAESDHTPWNSSREPRALSEWMAQAESIARRGDIRATEEAFLCLANDDFDAFVEHYLPTGAVGHGPNTITAWLYGYSVALNNGSDIWAVARVPLEVDGNPPVQVNAVVGLANVPDERVDAERAEYWGERAVVRWLGGSLAPMLLTQEATGAVEITHSVQPRAPLR